MWGCKLQSPGRLILIAVIYHIPLFEWHVNGRDTNGTLFCLNFLQSTGSLNSVH